MFILGFSFGTYLTIGMVVACYAYKREKFGWLPSMVIGTLWPLSLLFIAMVSVLFGIDRKK